MSDKDKQQRYLAISKQITEQIGGKDNIVASTHCATRLRIVLKDYDKINKEGIDNIDLVKGEFVAGNQLQIIFGAGLVNEIYEVFSAYTGTAGSSMADVKQEAAKKMNPLQAVIKSLSDVFVDIMPGILAAALLSGLTGVLSQWDVVAGNATLFGINRLVSLASNGIFSILPLAVCYSACKRYGGKPILGLVMGAIMLDGSLANAYDAAQGLVQPDSISLFGLNIELVGFQGGIIIALMMGFIVAKLDIFFDKKIPDVVKLLFSPMCSVLISTVLLFTIVGPAGRLLSNGITNGLIWMTQNLGLLGYMVFGGVQQIIVITGLHHIFGAIEAQLLSDTGRNFLNPLMSVALMGQGGAVLGYLALNWKNNKVKELCIPSFISTLFGISEPAIFGVNLRYKFPLVAGCIGGACGAMYASIAHLGASGTGVTGIFGILLCLNMPVSYIIMFVISAGVAFGVSWIITPRKLIDGEESVKESEETEVAEQTDEEEIRILSPLQGETAELSETGDETFASGALGEGIAIRPGKGEVVAPCRGTISVVMGHAIGIFADNGAELLIHVGIDTVELNGKYFDTKVEEGERVEQGQLLMTFDIQGIASEGYQVITPVLVTNSDEYNGILFEKKGTVKAGDPLIRIKNKKEG